MPWNPPTVDPNFPTVTTWGVAHPLENTHENDEMQHCLIWCLTISNHVLLSKYKA